ncbi:hypothetical protein NMG60_11024698 [Bertholletia excelsa]
MACEIHVLEKGWRVGMVYEHIVLVHYRDINELGSGSVSQLSSESGSTFSPTISSHTAQHLGSTAVVSELHEPHQSPGSVEDNSDAVNNMNWVDYLHNNERMGQLSSSSNPEVIQALQRLEEQLSLGEDSLEDIDLLCSNNENQNYSGHAINDQCRSSVSPDGLDDFMLQSESVSNGEHKDQALAIKCAGESKDPFTWKGMLESAESQDKILCALDENGMQPPKSSWGLEEQGGQLINYGGHNSGKGNDIPISASNENLQLSASASRQYLSGTESPLELPTSVSVSQEVESFEFPPYSPAINIGHAALDYVTTLFDQGQTGMHLETDSTLTIAQKQKFTIREISPDWGYAFKATKVVIVGSFLCDSLEVEWTCMFGDIEVPAQIIQEGVLCCQAPPRLPGKVTLCITSGNRESCSEVREFEYRPNPVSSAYCSTSQTGTPRSPEELLLLVRFVKMLLFDPSVQKGDTADSGLVILEKSKATEESWDHVIEALLIGSWDSPSTTDWLLQELLKDKLQQWLSSRSQGNQMGCSLSKKEQGIIHMVAGLGFEWALSPILNSGVSVNFRDINGWTALHWAARFGREKMVAALIASGALAWTVTDPNSKDPTGQTPASIAAAYGHNGLAGYLSEVALTSHLLSLKLGEREPSKNSANAEAEIALHNISESPTTSEDQLSLKYTLAAVRNASEAAARIQAAFRAYSFRRRKERETAAAAAAAATAAYVDDYIILSNDICQISAVSKLAFRNARDCNSAALSIQKKYRGWKGRKDFLALRQKVVKIQAHVRGHQVRKQYKVICWAVGILEKVILRWRRKGVGLRGFRQDMEDIDESDYEDILKVFRKQKVDKAIDDAVARVLSMVDCPSARQQYRRMLERYRQAKANLVCGENERTSTSRSEFSCMENEDTFLDL